MSLLPIALVPWIGALLFERGRWRALGSGILFGVVFWGISVSWVSFVVIHFGSQPGWMGAVCVFLLALILAQWPALIAFALVSAFPARSRWRIHLFPFLWMAGEHARSYVYKGFPWNLTADAIYRHPVWLQTASWGGAYLVGFFVAGVWVLLVSLLLAFEKKQIFSSAAALVVLVAGVAVFGQWRLAHGGPGPSARVALIQPDIAETSGDNPALDARNFEKVMAMTRRAGAGNVDLIVLPESALPLEWQRSELLRVQLAQVARQCRCDILFNDIDEISPQTYYNAARLLTPGGLAPATYHKIHLVPFGEYVPLPHLFFFMRAVTQQVGSFTAAREPVLLEDGRLKIGPAVCYEMTYPSLSRREVRLGANLLATISNDAWYGAAGAQEQHFSAMILRAIENSRSYVRAAITGVSGAADPRGRVLAQLGRDRQGIVYVRVPLTAGSTVWTREGILFPFAADVIALGVLLWGVARLWRRRNP